KVADGNDIAQIGDQHPHLPSPSYWPIVLAAGLPFIALGLIYNLWLSGIGLVFLLGGMFGWSLEPATDPDAGHGDHGDDHAPDPDTPDGDESEAAEVVEEAPVG
ncbi:MAG: cytochrome c oxidase subunit 4, partial [Acidimicrobiales bacterium]|nr:cytochrome c oxidase subunit 4 [Acidimicrobiales bacterium]